MDSVIGLNAQAVAQNGILNEYQSQSTALICSRHFAPRLDIFQYLFP